jgi:hypothetical protein
MSITPLPIKRLLWNVGVAAVAALLALGAGAAPAAAQGKASGTYLKEAFNRVTDNAALGGKIGGYGYIDGPSIVAAWIKEKGKVTFTLTLEANVDYLFLGAGDLDARDVDLKILNDRGETVAEDTRTAADAVVTFTPKVTGPYTMELILFESKNKMPCVCAATILRKGGANLSLKNLDEAVGNFVNALAAMDNELMNTAKKRLELHKKDGQWAMFGAVLAEGKDADVFNLSLGNGSRYFCATGDSRVQDVDLFLLNNDGTQTIKSDIRVDRDASFAHQLTGGLHRLRVHNHKSNGPSVCVMGVFDIVD